MKQVTRIKLCGLTRIKDIEAVNELAENKLAVDYVGFVFAPQSRRYITPEAARTLKERLDSAIQAVGVFTDAPLPLIADLLNRGLIGMAQLHGRENEEYLAALRKLTDRPLVQAFSIAGPDDIRRAEASDADYILLDSGRGGTGTAFDWRLAAELKRPYFLAGGLGTDNIEAAVKALKPFAVDVSSGIETDGRKDREKMAAFIAGVKGITILKTATNYLKQSARVARATRADINQ